MINEQINIDPKHFAHVKNILRNVIISNDESNHSKIAFIISVAIAAQFKVKIDQENISKKILTKTGNNRQVSLLDIKQIIHELGYATKAVQTHQHQFQDYLSKQILITQDNQNNFITLIDASESNIYFIFGKIKTDVILYSLPTNKFLEHLNNHKFLILTNSIIKFS